MSQSDGYRLIEQLGSGLSGAVFLAKSATSKVAIRLFQTEEEPLSPGWLLHREYFLKGARQMATLVNPRIVSVIEVIDEEADAFIAMEYVPGETLGLALDRDRFTTERANYLLRSIAVALDYAHHIGVTHGDLKPSNIFFTPQGGAKIGDFAISPRAWSGRSGNFPPQWVHPYLAPETISPQAPGPAADQYSLAAIASHLHTGQPPAAGVLPDGHSESARVLMPSAAAVLSRGLSRDPRSRYGSCLEFVDALDASFAPPTPVVEPLGFWSGKRLVYILGGVGLLAVLAIAAAVWPSHAQPKIVYTAPPPTAPPVVSVNSPPVQQTATLIKPSPMPNAVSPAPKQKPPAPQIDQAKFVSLGPDTTRGGGAGYAPKPVVVDPYPPVREPRQSKSPSEGKLPDSVLEPSTSTSGDPRGTNLQVYSRGRVIDPGISFSIKDQSLGELALGDLKVAVSVGSPPPKGQLSVEWLLNGLRMDIKPARNGSTVEYGNEPTPGTYRVLLRADKTVLKEFTFRITP